MLVVSIVEVVFWFVILVLLACVTELVVAVSALGVEVAGEGRIVFSVVVVVGVGASSISMVSVEVTVSVVDVSS